MTRSKLGVGVPGRMPFNSCYRRGRQRRPWSDAVVVKVILQLYPQLPAPRDERVLRRPLGRDRELYQSTLAGMHDLARAADDLGLWGISTIEHHFHSEGYEV